MKSSIFKANQTSDAMRKAYLLSIFLFPILIFAQSNPGNVGLTNLTAWFKADTLSTGLPVSSWVSSYPSGISLNSISPGGPFPVANNIVSGSSSNYNTTVDFTGSTDAANLGLFYAPTGALNFLDNSGSTSQGTMFLVYYNYDRGVTISNTGQHMLQYRENNTSGDGIQLRRLATTNRLAIGNAANVNATKDYTETFIPTILSYKGNYINSMAAYQNNSTLPASTIASTSSGLKGIYVGTRRNQTTSAFEGSYPGYISEIIFYNTNLTAIQMAKVHSYLAIKYGITLSNSSTSLGANGNYYSSNETTIWDATTNPEYHNNVIGIGRDDDQLLLQKQSHSFDDSLKLYINSLVASNKANIGNFAVNNSYIMLGNNGAALCKVSSSAEIPTGQGIFSRIDREWKVVKTNCTDTFNVVITLNACANASSINVADLRLLVDTDGDFTNANVIIPGVASGLNFSKSGNEITVKGISNDILAGTGFFTIASVSSSSPLPIKIISFDITKTGKQQSTIRWNAYVENESAVFTLQKSVDGSSWNNIHTIFQQQTNGNQIKNYSFIDNALTQNINYYRIMYKGVNGSTIYSEIKKLIIATNDTKGYNLYPNPAKDLVFIDLREDELNQIQVFSALGKNISKQISFKNSSHVIELNISQLPKGLYFIRINGQNISFVK